MRKGKNIPILNRDHIYFNKMEKKRNIVIEKLKSPSVEERDFEIVERKGIGHPDTICDGLCEAASFALSRYYFRKFKKVLHHNLDKGLLIAGKVKVEFGGGKILEPVKIIIAGRATDKVSKIKIPVKRIILKEVQNWLAKNLSFSQKEIKKFFEISIDYQEGAANLEEVFKKSEEIPIANDTSFGVAHGPLSKTEKLTLKVANLINSSKFSKKFPFLGKDIKVMSLREKNKISLTLVVAFISRYIKSIKDYFKGKEKLKREVEKYVRKNFNFDLVKIDCNTLDNPFAKSENEIYLTVTGLSAEQGDDGQVGRGNRVCGLITPLRQMSMEAVAGKNINHPGKLYQILSFLIAQEIGKIEGVKECYVKILSEIGKPLDSPQIALIELNAKNFSKVKDKAFLICQNYLNNLKKVQKEIIEGKYRLF